MTHYFSRPSGGIIQKLTLIFNSVFLSFFIAFNIEAGQGFNNLNICVQSLSDPGGTLRYSVRLSNAHCLEHVPDGQSPRSGHSPDQEAFIRRLMYERNTVQGRADDGTVYPYGDSTITISNKGIKCLNMGYFEVHNAALGACSDPNSRGRSIVTFVIEGVDNATDISFGVEAHQNNSLELYHTITDEKTQTGMNKLQLCKELSESGCLGTSIKDGRKQSYVIWNP